MVDVHIEFAHVCCDGTRREWTHDYNIRKGTTIRKLRQVMVLPNGTPEEANCFELRKGGRRVADFVQVWQESTFQFKYIGPEEGTKKAALDDAREAGEAEAEVDLSGKWAMVDAKGGKAHYVIKHEPGSDKFTGEQVGFASISGGTISGKTIEWEVGGFKCKGRVEDSGRTIADLHVVMENGRELGVYQGMLEYDDSCWGRHEHYDLKGRKDVENMKANDIEAVKRRVEKMGYTGFAVWKGFAYIKAAGKPLTRDDLEWCGDENEVVFYLFTPPDPYEDGSEEEEDSKPAETAKPPAESKPPAQSHQAPPQSKPASQEVDVTVRHAMPEQESQITVKVKSDAKVYEVRRAVMEALGEARLSEVKIVRRSGKSFTSIDNEEPVGDRREFLSMGRILLPKDSQPGPATSNGQKPAGTPASAKAAAPSPTGPATFKITCADDESEKEVSLPLSLSVRELKQKICEQVQRGPASRASMHVYNDIFDKIDRELHDADKLDSIDAQDRASLRIVGISLGPPAEVEVTVKHGTAEHSVTVSVPDTSTMFELKKAVAAKIGCPASDVRMVKKLSSGSGGWASATDSERLNGRTEFTCLGRGLESPPSGAQRADAAAAAKTTGGDVEVTVAHTTSGRSEQVKVPDTSTMLQLRKAVAAKLGCPHSDLRIVKRLAGGSGGYQSVLDSVRLNGLTEFTCMGKALEVAEAAPPPPAKAPEVPTPAAPPAQAKDLKITVTVERTMGFTMELEAKAGSTIAELKQQLAATDPTGQAKPDDWSMGISPKADGEEPRPLADSTVLGEEHVRLDLITKTEEEKAGGGAEQAPAASQDVEVTLTHAMDGTSVQVSMPADATIIDVRRAVMSKIGQSKLSEVKIVKKQGASIQSLGDSEPLNGRTALKTMGCPLSS